MSVTCNKAALRLDAPGAVAQYRRNVAKKAASSALGAVGEVLLALELLENDQPAHAVATYFDVAETKLAVAREGYAEIRNILAEYETSPEVLAWRKGLDYGDLYSNGVRQGLMPEGSAAWASIQEACLAADAVFAPIDLVISKIEEMHGLVVSLARRASVETDLSALSSQTVEIALQTQSAMAEFLILFRQITFLNSVKLNLDSGTAGPVELADAVLVGAGLS